jgi:peptide/nickel transport system permease protein
MHSAHSDPSAIQVERILAGPCAQHCLGADDFGRDLLARILHGTRLSLTVEFSSEEVV